MNQEPTKERRDRRKNQEFGREAVCARMLPQSPDAELGLIGSILLSPDKVFETCEEKAITPEHFYIPKHATIFRRLCEMHDAKKPIDIVVLTQLLRDTGELDQVGGASTITDLFTFVPTASNAAYYADIIAEKYLRRRVILTCNEFAARAYEEDEEIQVFCDDVQAEMMTLTETQTTGAELRHVKDGMFEAIESVENAYEHRGRTTGLATGYKQYDRMTNGLQPAEMTVIAARPSMGKTALGMNIAEAVALGDAEEKRAGFPVAIFSLEMSYQQLCLRTLMGQSRVSMQRVRDGFMAQGDFERMTKQVEILCNAPIYIDDTPALRILEFRARARRAVRKLGVKLIVIDYLQLMRGNSRRGRDDRQLEVCEISGGIKAAAKELGIPIIVLAQLNREPDKRKGGETKLSDLRESGSIEQDADVVALLHRPEYYLPKGSEVPEDLQGKAIVTIAKQRNGGVGPITLKFIADLTRFENWNAEEKTWSTNKAHRQKGYEPGDEEEDDA